MIIKRYKNGNFTAKREPGEEFHDGPLVHLIWALYDKDCELFGEEYCLSNWEMACDLYCYYTDMIIRIPYGCLEDLENGKMIRLYARKPDKWEREQLQEMEESA